MQQSRTSRGCVDGAEPRLTRTRLQRGWLSMHYSTLILQLPPIFLSSDIFRFKYPHLIFDIQLPPHLHVARRCLDCVLVSFLYQSCACLWGVFFSLLFFILHILFFASYWRFKQPREPEPIIPSLAFAQLHIFYIYIYIYLFFSPTLPWRFTMLPSVRRRVLDPLNRRYIYGRVVCSMNRWEMVLYKSPSLLCFSAQSAVGRFTSQLRTLPFALWSVWQETNKMSFLCNVIAFATRDNFSDWDGGCDAAGSQVQLLLCGEAG